MKTISIVISAILFAFMISCGNTLINGPDLNSDVYYDLSNLTIGYGPGDSQSWVTQDLTLPITGVRGSAISWSSNNPSIIANDGTVTRPTEENMYVRLTATATKDNESLNTNFFQRVIVGGVTAIAKDLDDLTITYATGDSADSVTDDIILPTDGAYGSTITWTSSASTIITPDGEVTRPSLSSGNTLVTLTATASLGSKSDSRTYELTVLCTSTVFHEDFGTDGFLDGSTPIVSGSNWSVNSGNSFPISDGVLDTADASLTGHATASVLLDKRLESGETLYLTVTTADTFGDASTDWAGVSLYAGTQHCFSIDTKNADYSEASTTTPIAGLSKLTGDAGTFKISYNFNSGIFVFSGFGYSVGSGFEIDSIRLECSYTDESNHCNIALDDIFVEYR